MNGMNDNRLIYVPLGGAGEIGMNMYVYGFGPTDREQLIIVDAGVMFPDMETTPGVDLILPDITWLKKRAGRVKGIFLTHAHEDHIGAIAHLLRAVKAPVYATRFTASIGQKKLEEADIPAERIRCVESKPGAVTAGPFKVRFVPVTHSIPEASALIIESAAGKVVHTGDFKVDDDPLVGAPFNKEFWQNIGRAGITALMCDSTNVFFDRKGRSEASIGPALAELFADAKGIVAATTFASNVARVRQIAGEAEKCGRTSVLLGRAMNRMVDAALKAGVIKNFPLQVSPEQALKLPRDRVLLLTTGSQGEPRSATSQLSNGKFRGFRLVKGDMLLISSRTIPGNEAAVARVVNRFSASGVRVIEDHKEIYHVSGHANRRDLTELQLMLSPKLVVPMHGEHRHLVAHAELAEENGFKAAVVANGSMLDVNRGKVTEDHAKQAGREYLDGHGVISATSGIVRDRLKLARDGAVMVSAVLGHRWADTEIGAKCIGIGSANGRPADIAVIQAAEDCLRRIDADSNDDVDRIEREVAIAVRRAVLHATGKKPVISVFLSGL